MKNIVDEQTPRPTLLRSWSDFVLSVGHRPELVIAGEQRIYRDVGWTLDPNVFFDGSLTLESTGYTPTKLSALQRNYYNPDSIARAKADLAWRIEHKKYGSGAFDFRGTPKKNTKQDFCIQSCVISFYPQKRATTIQVFWRTVELIKRFRGDLLFLRDFILPHFAKELDAAPPMQIDFRFASATFHPMMAVLLVQGCAWRKRFEQIKRENPKLFRSICYWGWCYCLDTSHSIDKYSSARQVRRIASKTTDTDRMMAFKLWLRREIKCDLDNYPKSVQSYYA